MSFKLQIDFQGLIAAVPVNGGESMQILLVESRNGRKTSDGDHVPPHYPVVRFDRRNVVDLEALRDHEQGKQKIIFLGSSDLTSEADLTGLWLLDSQDLEVRYDAANDQNNGMVTIWNKDLARGESRFAGKSPDQYFSLVPHLEDISYSSSRVDPDCLRPNPTSGLIAARFKIKEGLVQAAQLERDQNGRSVPLDFRPFGADLRGTVFSQAVSDGIQLEMEIPTDSATLVSTEFGSGEKLSVLKLAPFASQGTTPVRVQVWNLPLEDTLGLPRHSHGSSSADKHFELFYELSLQRPPLHLRPVPHLANGGNGGNGGSGGHHDDEEDPIRITDIYCPPVAFQG